MSLARTMVVAARVAVLRAGRRSSTYALGALALLPAALGAVMGSLGHGAVGTAGPVAVRVVAPLLVIALVAGTVGEAFEQRTVVYYFVRPVARAAVLAGESVGYALVAAGVLSLSGAFLAIANALTGTADLASLARVPLALAAEGVTLVGFCVGIATLVPKHPLVTAVGILALTEGALANVPGRLQYASMSYHVGNLAGLAVDTAETASALSAPVSVVVSLVALALYAAAPFALAMLVVNERDLV